VTDSTQIQQAEATGTVFDAAGPRGTARAADPRAVRTLSRASLALWLVHAPSYHPLWAHYVCSVVHLRPLAGDSQPAVLHYPVAQYEIVVYASQPPPAPEDFMRWYEAVLTPVNIVFQFHGVSDEGAAAVLAQLVRAFCDGKVSPDTDYRTMQIGYLTHLVAEQKQREELDAKR
jgi:hypothetical protein